MNDETIERHLHALPDPELPGAWRAEILSAALRGVRDEAPARRIWPPVWLYLRGLFLRHTFSAGALATLWLFILLFRVTTPVDPSEKELMAHFDPSRPLYFVSLREELRLAEEAQESAQPRPEPIP